MTYLLDVLDTRRTDEHGVTVLALHEGVVRNPAEGNLSHCQVVLLRDSLDLCEGAEVGLLPVASAVVLQQRKNPKRLALRDGIE